ncbi:MAG: hypothetical protein KXJ48_08485, partial [Vulcanococcus sp.]|nr:hypothetical protein [Vulcanococcus sp.]
TSAVQDGASVSVQVVAENATTAAITPTAPTTSGGTWSATQNISTLSNGNYTVQTSVTDGAGNTATDSQAISINKNPPVFSSTAVAGDNRINAAEAAATLAPSFSGVVTNAEDGQPVSVTLPGVGTGSNTVAGRTLTATVSGGAWNLAIPTDLLNGYSANNGTFSAAVSLSNQAGNPASTTHDFRVDTVAPVFTYTNPTDAQWGASGLDPDTNPLTLTGTVQGLENGQAVTVQINGSDLQATRTNNDNTNTSSWSLSVARQLLQGLRAAGNNIAISARDLAGNLASITQSFNANGVGTTPPLILDLPANREITAKEGDLLIRQFKANQAVSWGLLNTDPNLLGINSTTGSFSFFKPLSITDTNPSNLAVNDRNLSFTLVATDVRGNQKTENLTLLVRNVADTTPDSFDQDGISSSLEAVATNGRGGVPGDLNNDGIPDNIQTNVTAVPWISKENFQAAQASPSAAAANSFATLQTSNDIRIASVDVRNPEELAVTGNGTASVPALINGNTVSYPYDPLVFRLESYDPLNETVLNNFVDIAPNTPGVQVRQLIDLPGNGLAINTYLKWNPSANNGAGSWFNFLADGNPNTYDNGAELFDNNGDGLIDQILLTYTDGDPAGGDIDGLVNGIIDDPGMPALLQAPSSGGGGGNGGTATPSIPSTPRVDPAGVPIDPAPAGTNIQPTDDDGDGLREVTFAADDYGVDGNRDRVLDAEQGQVAGIRLINDGAKYSDYGALVVSGDVALRGVTLLPTTAAASVAVTLADGSTVNAALPAGITNTFAGSLAFELSGLTPGGTTEALIYLPVGYAGDGSAYVRYNYATQRFEDYRDAEGNRLYAFTDTDGDGFGDAITLTLTDGDAQWDGDGVANGSVVDPGFLASGATEITGDGASNRLSGNILANMIRGKGRADRLIGDLGDDILRGGGGHDRLNGGEGADIVIGGGGVDRFRYSALVDSTLERSDTIQFNRRDQIDLRQLDANATRKGNQAFRFVADAEFSGKAGELRLFESRLLADVDGDRQADFALNLRSNQAFSVDVLLL